MALFSQRFWLRLSALDARVVATQRAYREANGRLLIGRRLVLGVTLEEYWQEVRQATEEARSALVELNHFCAGRTRSEPVTGTSVADSMTALPGLPETVAP